MKNVTNKKNLREAAEKSIAGMITIMLCTVMIVSARAIERLLMKVRAEQLPQNEYQWISFGIAILLLIVGLIIGVFSTALYKARKPGGRFLKRELILQRIKTRSDSERVFDESRKLILEIFSRLNIREMTGEQAYRIFEKLDSQSLEELRQTQKDLLDGEEQIRAQIIERVCADSDVSNEQKIKLRETLKEALSDLTLSELETV